MFIELLGYIELTEKLICTCSPTLVLTKGTKAHQRKVSSVRLIAYTAHCIRAGLDFQDRVPVLSVLGLPLDMVRARVKFWSGTDGAKSFTRLNLSVPNQFFWYAYFFHPSSAKNFRPCKWGLSRSTKADIRCVDQRIKPLWGCSVRNTINWKRPKSSQSLAKPSLWNSQYGIKVRSLFVVSSPSFVVTIL